MDMKIAEKKEEPLLSRMKLTGEVAFEAATPSYEEVKKKIASSLNCDEKLIAMKNIYTKFGIKKGDFLAYVYTNEEAMKKIEPKKKEKKAKEAKAEKPAAKPEEAKKAEEKKPEEAPKEGKKEEKAQQKEQLKEEKPGKKEEKKGEEKESLKK